MRKFCVYYDDNRRRWVDCEEQLESLVAEGVIVIAQEDEDVGRELLHQRDYYYWEEGRWYGCDLYGLFDYLRRPGWKKVLAGRNTYPGNYHRLMDRARLDPELPGKTARLTGERAER